MRLWPAAPGIMTININHSKYSWYIDCTDHIQSLIMHRFQWLLWTSETQNLNVCTSYLPHFCSWPEHRMMVNDGDIRAPRAIPFDTSQPQVHAREHHLCFPPGWTTLTPVGGSHRLRAMQSQCMCVCVYECLWVCVYHKCL